MNHIGNMTAAVPPGDAVGFHARRPPHTQRLLRAACSRRPHRTSTVRTPMRAAACSVVRR
ncbi:hypothetical protein ACV229_05835 [Burkholderia sp. MR1-5-21]